MPPRRGGRSVSRRSTPQSPPKLAASDTRPQRHTGRSTRSQSHELDPDVRLDHQRPGLEQSSLEVGSPRQWSRRVANNAANHLDLAIVHEEEQELVRGGTSQHEDASDDEIDEVLDAEDSDVISVGSTAHTSHSIAEIRSLDRSAIVDAIPDLFHDSVSVLTFFEHGDPAELQHLHTELMSSTSRPCKRLVGLLTAFESSREPFGQGHYIKSDVVARTLAGIETSGAASTGIWRPDAVFCLANLAKLIATMFTGARTSSAASILLRSLDIQFPYPYLPVVDETGSLKPWSASAMDQETVGLALEIRTQFLIEVMMTSRQQPNFDPGEAINQVFYNDGGLRSIGDLENQSKLPEDFQQMFIHRVRAVKKHLSVRGDDFVDFAHLQDQFSWSAFLTQLAVWTRSRTSNLQSQVDRQEGVDVIQKRLKDELLAWSVGFEQPALTDDPEADVVVETATILKQSVSRAENNGGPVPNAPDSSSGPLHIKERQSLIRKRKSEAAASRTQNSPGKTELQPPPSAQPAPKRLSLLQEDKGILPATAEEDEMLPAPPRSHNTIIPSQQTVLLTETLMRQATQSNKENIDTSKARRTAFVDRQRGAHRLNFEDSQDVEQSPPSRPPSKRPRDDAEDESDFETDDRPNKRLYHNRRGRLNRAIGSVDAQDPDQAALDRQLTSPQRPPSKNVRSPLQPRQNLLHPSSSAPQATSTTLSRTRSTVSITPPPASQPVQVNRDAKARTQQHRNQKAIANPRTAQGRRPYSEAEVLRLIELIEDYGTSWATLLRFDAQHPAGPRLGGRTQINIKDKARNLKMDYLKAGATMPRNFTEIKLGQRLVAILEDLRVPHHEDLGG